MPTGGHRWPPATSPAAIATTPAATLPKPVARVGHVATGSGHRPRPPTAGHRPTTTGRCDPPRDHDPRRAVAAGGRGPRRAVDA